MLNRLRTCCTDTVLINWRTSTSASWDYILWRRVVHTDVTWSLNWPSGFCLTGCCRLHQSARRWGERRGGERLVGAATRLLAPRRESSGHVCVWEGNKQTESQRWATNNFLLIKTAEEFRLIRNPHEPQVGSRRPEKDTSSSDLLSFFPQHLFLTFLFPSLFSSRFSALLSIFVSSPLPVSSPFLIPVLSPILSLLLPPPHFLSSSLSLFPLLCSSFSLLPPCFLSPPLLVEVAQNLKSWFPAWTFSKQHMKCELKWACLIIKCMTVKKEKVYMFYYSLLLFGIS